MNITMPVNAPIPGATGPPARDGELDSQISVGKRFKGRSIGDVNVTVQTKGATAAQTILTANPVRAQDPLVFYAPIGVAVVSLIATLAFTAKYENSRWETYF